MSTIATQLTEVQTALTATQADIATMANGITQLNQTIVALQAEITNQGDELSPSTTQLLESVVAQAASLKTAADAAAGELPAAPAAPAAPASSDPAAS